MKLQKVYEKAKKYLLLIDEQEEIEKKKLKKLQDKIDEKILKLEKRIHNIQNQEDEIAFNEEIELLKKFKNQLEEKK